MKARYTGSALIVLLVIIVLFFGTAILSQPVVDCDKLMEQRTSLFGSMNTITDALERNEDTVTEEEKIEGLELIDKMLEAEDKLAVEWKSKCS